MHYSAGSAIEVLWRTPTVLQSMLGGLSDSWVLSNYGDKTFSPFDVVGHLIHGERTDWIPRARIIFDHGESVPFESFDRHAQYESSEGKTLADLLDTFADLRAANIDALRAMDLTPAKLALRGRHPELGTVTLENHLATWVTHDLNHIAQIAKAMAYQYRSAVGPWLAYISILPR